MGVGLLRAEVCIGLCDGTREARQADQLVTWTRGKLGLPGQYVHNTWPVCNTVLWSAGVTTFLSQDLCEGESPFEYPLHPALFLSLLLKPSHLDQEKVQTISLASLSTDHTLGLVAGAQKDYSQSLELPKRPSTAEQQEWFPGSWENASAKTAMALAAGLVLSSPSSPEYSQFRFLGTRKIDRYLAMVKVVMIAVSLLRTGATYASARGCPDCASQWMMVQPHRCHFQLEWHDEAVDVPLRIGLDALLLPHSSDFSCPMQSCIFTVWLQLTGVFWLSVLWYNSGQQCRWFAHRLFGSFLLQSRRSSLIKWMWPQRHAGSHQSCSVLNAK